MSDYLDKAGVVNYLTSLIHGWRPADSGSLARQILGEIERGAFDVDCGEAL